MFPPALQTNCKESWTLASACDTTEISSSDWSVGGIIRAAAGVHWSVAGGRTSNVPGGRLGRGKGAGACSLDCGKHYPGDADSKQATDSAGNSASAAPR